MVITVKAVEPIPVGEYIVKLVELTSVEGKFGEQLRFKLEVVHGEHAGQLLYAYASPSSNPQSKCIRWASAFYGRPIEIGETIDLQSLVGKQARAIVLVKQLADGREVNSVQDILALKRSAKAAEETLFKES